GDMCAICEGAGATGKTMHTMFRDSELVVETEDGQVAVLSRLFNRNGNTVVELSRNEWKVAPPPQAWDRNYSRDALEVKDDTGDIVLQVRVLSDRVRIQGKWYAPGGQDAVAVIKHPNLPNALLINGAAKV